MKLLRFGPQNDEKPGMLDEHGQIRDLSGLVSDIVGNTPNELQGVDLSSLPIVEGQPRLGPCVTNVGKFICIGLNYSDHAAETGGTVPEEPIVFFKATSAISGPNDNVVIPRNSSKTDWEVELAIIIGEAIKYANEEEAERAIAGYCVCNDLSEREFQLERAGQWVKGKSCDSFGPIGPWFVTRDEIGDVSNLSMWLSVNGHKFQDGNTNTMVFKPAYIVSYLSQFMSLQAGDIISTGTPPGVGLGQTPPVYLKEGDVVELGIEGLGEQRQEVVGEANVSP